MGVPSPSFLLREFRLLRFRFGSFISFFSPSSSLHFFSPFAVFFNLYPFLSSIFLFSLFFLPFPSFIPSSYSISLFPFFFFFFFRAQLDTMVEETQSRVARLQSEFSVLHAFLFPKNHPRPQNLHELKQFSAKHSDQFIKLSNLHKILIRLKYPNIPISAPPPLPFILFSLLQPLLFNPFPLLPYHSRPSNSPHLPYFLLL